VGIDTRGARPLHAGGAAEVFTEPDEPGSDIHLMRVDPVPGTRRIGVVQVVPAVAEGQDHERLQVRRAIVPVGAEGTRSDEVAQRVDAPGDVMQKEDAYQADDQQRDGKLKTLRHRPGDLRCAPEVWRRTLRERLLRARAGGIGRRHDVTTSPRKIANRGCRGWTSRAFA
jgi:hypothetical protein